MLAGSEGGAMIKDIDGEFYLKSGKLQYQIIPNSKGGRILLILMGDTIVHRMGPWHVKSAEKLPRMLEQLGIDEVPDHEEPKERESLYATEPYTSWPWVEQPETD